MIENAKNFLKLIRWFHELLAIFPFIGLYFVIQYFVKLSGQTCHISGFDFIVLCLCVQLLLAAGCILNDIMDRDIDKINKPNTHIIGRTVSLSTAKRWFFLLSILALVLSVYIACYVFTEWAFIAAAVYLLSVLYDVYLKRSPLIGNIVMAALASFIPLVLFFFARDCIETLNSDKLNMLILLYCFFPFFIIIPRELSLDISDMEGDKAIGCKTLPILIGVKKAKWVVALFILTIIGGSVIVSANNHYLLSTFIGIDLLLLVYLYLLKKSEKRIDYIKAGRFLWFVFILGLIGFTLATVYS